MITPPPPPTIHTHTRTHMHTHTHILRRYATMQCLCILFVSENDANKSKVESWQVKGFKRMLPPPPPPPDVYLFPRSCSSQ